MNEITGLVQALLIAFAVVLAVLWVLVPFAVFGCLKHLAIIRQHIEGGHDISKADTRTREDLEKARQAGQRVAVGRR
jgi:hypothetical protein